jgi:hypothetical protein
MAILVLFAIATLLSLVVELGRDPIRQANFFRIQAGMSSEEVREILGSPTDYTQGTVAYQYGAREEAGGKLKVIFDDWDGPIPFTSAKKFSGTPWFGREGAIVVYWDDSDKVAKKEFFVPAEKSPRSYWLRLRALFPW